MRASPPGRGPEDLASRFRRFAARECAGISPLYHALALEIAQEPELLELASKAHPGQPAPNMLLAAVHALLLGECGGDPLADFYPDLTDATRAPGEAFPAFRDFCLRQRTAIAEILAARVVGTNEAARSACLLPGFVTVARAQSVPLHVVEVGTSAGLNLLWDRYGYDYGAGRKAGDGSANLTLRCDLRGHDAPPELPAVLPKVASRSGIDPQPLDPRNPNDRAWLRALIWPEQRERAARLERALAIAASAELSIYRGDALDLLPNVLAAVPPGAPVCIFHCFTLNQFGREAREAFDRLLRRLAAGRPVARLGLEWEDEHESPVLRLTRYRGRDAKSSLLALCDAHGSWIEWRARSTSTG